jgi:hypothetical protein
MDLNCRNFDMHKTGVTGGRGEWNEREVVLDKNQNLETFIIFSRKIKTCINHGSVVVISIYLDY